MTPFEWISLGLVLISGIGSLGALLISALVTALWAFARARDSETQAKLHAVTGRVDQLGTTTSKLEERSVAAEANAVEVRGALTRLEAAVHGVAVTVATIVPKRRA